MNVFTFSLRHNGLHVEVVRGCRLRQHFLLASVTPAVRRAHRLSFGSSASLRTAPFRPADAWLGSISYFILLTIGFCWLVC